VVHKLLGSSLDIVQALTSRVVLSSTELSEWLWLDVSNGSNRVDVSLLSPEDGRRSRFRNELLFYVGFEVFTVVTMKDGVSWDVTPCGSCKNRRFGGT
jgi:hypothetical protein